MDELTQVVVALGLPTLWLLLLALLIGTGEIGFRLGRWRAAAVNETERGHTSTLVAGMLTLLAFSLGLSISFAQNRYETRRDLVMNEANAIGTAWLRAGVVEGADGERMQRLLEDYTRVRLAYVTASAQDDLPAMVARTTALQNEVWGVARDVARRAPTPISASLIAALNDMIDLSLSQRFAFISRVPPYLVWSMLFGSLLSMGALKYNLGLAGSRHFLLSTLLVMMWTGAMILVVDFNRPRVGALRVDPSPLIWTLEGFGTPAR